MNSMNQKIEAREVVDPVVKVIEKSLRDAISKPSRARWFLAGAVVGVVGYLLFEPENGKRRREQMMNRARDLSNHLPDWTHSETRH